MDAELIHGDGSNWRGGMHRDLLPKTSKEDMKELPRRAENTATILKGRGYLSQMVLIIRHNQV